MANQGPRDPRAPRNADTREATSRPTSWKEPSKLPDPNPEDGMVHRWVRTATLGQADPTNVSTRFREGWTPVPKEDVDYLHMMPDHRSRFPDNLEVGGLLLCKMPEDTAKARQDHYEKMAQQQVQASDHNFLKQSDPRMPLLKPERNSTTSWGSGRPQK